MRDYVPGVPELDLDPGEYRERKPKGWRWRLPWSHPEDSKLHLAMFFVGVAFGAFFFINRDQMSSAHVFGAGALWSGLAVAQLMLAFRD